MAYDKEKIKQQLLANVEADEHISTFEDAAATVKPSRQTLYTWGFDGLESINKALRENRKGDSIERKIKKIRAAKIEKGCGYVYLVNCVGTNYYKIGISKADPKNRIANLQSGCPLELEFEDIYYCKHYSLLEYEIHKRYSKLNVRGEWYELNESQLLCVKSELQEQSNKQLRLF